MTDPLVALLTALVHADAEVSDQEFKFLFRYLRRRSASQRASGTEQLQAIATMPRESVDQGLLAALGAMKGKAYLERLGVLLRAWDFAAVDGVSASERRILTRAADQLGIRPEDRQALESVVAPQIQCPEGARLRVLTIGPDAPEVKLPTEATLTLVQLGSERLVRCEGLVHVDETALPVRILVELPERFRLTAGPYTLGPAEVDALLAASALPWTEVDAASGNPLPGALILHRRGALQAVLPLRPGMTVSGEPLEPGVRRILMPGERVVIDGRPVLFSGTWDNPVLQADLDSGDGVSTRMLLKARGLEDTEQLTHLVIDDLRVEVGDLTLLDGVSFEAARGELVAIIGPSGCGKTTLFEALSGRRRIHGGSVSARLGERYVPIEEGGAVADRLSIVPQDGVLLPQLTVREATELACRVRLPRLDRATTRKVSAEAIEQMGLSARADVQIGSPERRLLSGGQRKRVTIAMELVSRPEVLLLDEPLSGLSSHDARSLMVHFVDLARRGRIVMVIVHQVSAELFRYFDKVLVLDRGGKLAFFGPPGEALSYFAGHGRAAEPGEAEPAGEASNPDVILATMEERDADGARTYPPDYWQALFRFRHPERKPRVPPVSGAPKRPRLGLGSRLTRLATVFKRHRLIRTRSRAALVLSLVLSPFLGALLGLVLRHTAGGAEGAYSFGANNNLAHFLFLAPVVTFFLGMTGACTEFITERRLVRHERALGVPTRAFLLSKLGVLSTWGALETALFVGVSGAILAVPGPWAWYFLLCLLVSWVGMATGLFVSTLAANVRVAFSCVPLALIPQLLFGGTIPYQKMNEAVYLGLDEQRLDAPLVGQIMPVRWGYEGLAVAFATADPWTRSEGPAELDALKADERALVLRYKAGEVDREQLSTERDAIFERRKALLETRDSVRNRATGQLVDTASATARARADEGARTNVFLAPERDLFGAKMSAPLAAVVVLCAQLLLLLLATALTLRRR